MAVYPNDMLHPSFLKGAIEARPDSNAIKQSYIGNSLLPTQEVPERRLLWDVVSAENNLAGFYSSKGHAIPGDDIMFSTKFADLVDVKASRYLDPDIVAKVRDPGMPAVIKSAGDSFVVKGIAERIRKHVTDNLAWCDDAVDAQLEYMAVNAMLGTLTWPPVAADGSAITAPMPHWNADEILSVTFPLYASFKQDASTLTGHNSRTGGGVEWRDSTADPILDLEVIAELMVEEKGIDPSEGTIIMSRATLSRIAFLPNVLRWLVGKVTATVTHGTGNPPYANVSTVKDFIETKLGYKIQTYDAQWTYRVQNAGTAATVNRVKFLPEGRLIIIPNGANPGYMAVAPHETQEGNYASGKIPWVHREPIPPYERQMGVNLVSFPILERPEEHFVLDCYA